MIAARHYKTLSFVIVDNLGLYVKRIGRLIYECPVMQETRPDPIVDASQPRVNHSNERWEPRQYGWYGYAALLPGLRYCDLLSPAFVLMSMDHWPT